MGRMKPGGTAPAGDRRTARKQERQQLKAALQIGGRLRQMRGQHGLTQEQVAALLGLNRTAYTHYENGVNMPDVLTLVRLAEVYGVPPQEFLGFLTGP